MKIPAGRVRCALPPSLEIAETWRAHCNPRWEPTFHGDKFTGHESIAAIPARCCNIILKIGAGANSFMPIVILMSHIQVSLIILTLALSLSPAALGEVYKWVDAEGQVHYSDHRPPSVKDAEVFDIPADRSAKRLKIIEDLARRLVRLLNKEDKVSREARELTQELAQQAEMDKDQQLDKIRELAWELTRQLQGEGDLISETTRPTARALLEEIQTYPASALKATRLFSGGSDKNPQTERGVGDRPASPRSGTGGAGRTAPQGKSGKSV